jgi:vitamin B12 transporter
MMRYTKSYCEVIPKTLIIIGLCIVLANTLTAQIADTTLPEVRVTAPRFDQIGYTSWRSDTALALGASTLAERLLLEQPLLVRANAPGTLATASARGMGPNRTLIVWEGLSLQSPQNGVTDLALIPTWPQDEIEVRTGGQSAAFSSGAMGGSILLGVPAPTRYGWHVQARAEAGSFDRRSGGVTLKWRSGPHSSQTRCWVHRARNDFKYRNTALIGMPTVRQLNNEAQRIDIQQVNIWSLSGRTSLRTSLWHQNVWRQIPPSMTEAPSNAWQRDRNTRMIATLDHTPHARALVRVRAAYNDEWLAFFFAGQTDSSHARTALLSTEYVYQLRPEWRMKSGIQTQRQWAQADGYADSSRWWVLQRSALYAMSEGKWRHWHWSGQVRQEYFGGERVPLVWSAGAERKCGTVPGVRWHVSRNFNVPTFNDRYWQVYGKPDLRPESGYSADVGIFQRTENTARRAVMVEATLYALEVRDWILWQPGADGIFRPDNLRRVRSLGGEGHVRYELRAHGHWVLDGRYQYVRAVNVAVYSGAQTALGHDLIYTPRHSGTVTLSYKNNWLSMSYAHQLSGRRFTNSDNSGVLRGYQTGTLLASVRLGSHWTLDGRVDNTGDVAWQMIEWRPMPGRSWNLGVTAGF